MIRYLAALVMGAAVVLSATVAPAGAIETNTFGIDVVQRDPEGRLRIAIKAGEDSTGRLRVWNKHDAPLVLRLSIVPAQVASDGTASFGGDTSPVEWVDVPNRVELGPGATREVTVEVAAPRELDGDTKTVAVLAEPEVIGDAPAVLQRLAVTTYLVPDRGSLIASLGWLPWLALALMLAVGGGAGYRVRRRIVQGGGRRESSGYKTMSICTSVSSGVV